MKKPAFAFAAIAALVIGLSMPSFGAAFGFGSPIYWMSGTITMPNGQVAGEGDVTMYALVTWGHMSQMEKLQTIDLYSLINAPEEPDWAKEYVAVLLSGQSNASGYVTLTDGTTSTAGDFNQWAMVLFVCEQDGYEYYGQRFAEHYITASPQRLSDQNIAKDLVWKQGLAVASPTPEPSSALLLALGIALLAVRRGKSAA